MKAAWLGIVMMLTQAAPAQETFSASSTLDAVVDAAVREGLIPGAVLVVGHDGRIVISPLSLGAFSAPPSGDARDLA